MKTDHISIDGVYVDESFEDENLALLYMFYTIDAKDTNLELASSTINLKINRVNDYSSTVSLNYIPKYTDYAYSDFNKKVYVGKSYKMCSTFKIAKGDLEEGKEIRLDSYKISDLSNIHFNTNKVKRMEDLSKISEDLDKATFDTKVREEQETMSNANSSTDKKVKKLINGYEFTSYVNVGTTLTKLRLEFDKPNKFKVTNGPLSNSGTYTVKKGALVLKYKTGKSVTILYEFKNNDINFTNLNDVFGTYVDYDPMKE